MSTEGNPSVQTDNAHPQRCVLVVGANPDWDEARQVAASAGLVLCYTLEGMTRLRDVAASPPEIIELGARPLELDPQTWRLSSELLLYLRSHAPWLPQATTQVARRSMFMWTFWPIALAEARARVVQERIDATTTIRATGTTDLERTALHASEPHAAGDMRETQNCETRPVSVSGLGLGSAIDGVIGMLPDARRRGVQLHDVALTAREAHPSGMRCAVLVSQRVHLRALAGALAELSARGWRHLLLDMSIEGDVIAEAPDSFEQRIHLNPLDIVDGTAIDVLAYRLNLDRTTKVVEEWAHLSDLGDYAQLISSGFVNQYRCVASYAHAHRAILRQARPDVILCANETSPVIEAVVPAARALHVPTVNVQHGVISTTRRRADFQFDKFCVFGQAYADTLEALGTSSERIAVVGNPFFDCLPTAAASRAYAASLNAAPTEGNEPQPFTILFAAQHANHSLSEWTLYSSLKVLLEYLEGDPSSRAIIKLHPLGEGHEAGYELALSEHPGASVTVVRDASLFDLMYNADCMATHSSTVAFEAPSLRMPCVLLNPTVSDGLRPLLVHGTAFHGADIDGFAKSIQAIKSGQVASQQDYDRVDELYAYKRDGRSGMRIADVCESLARRGHPRPSR